MSRRLALGVGATAVVALAVLAGAPGVVAAVRDVTVGNYYFEDDQTKQRNPIEAQQGDQLRFTVREASYPQHSVNVDELNIRSGDLAVFDTFTTPPLDRPGNYRLYCRAHTDRGHITRLIVHPAPATTTTRAAAGTTSTTARVPSSTTTTSAGGDTSTTTAAPSGGTTPTTDAAAPITTSTLAPVGVGRATDRRRAEPGEGSLASILGRRPAEEGPWTRALRLGAAAGALVALVVVATLLAVQRREDEPS